jgi:hypothetical protein
MSPKKLTNFRIDEELLTGLERLRLDRGISVSEQVRRAIQDWLVKQGVKVKAAPRRVSARRKA